MKIEAFITSFRDNVNAQRNLQAFKADINKASVNGQDKPCSINAELTKDKFEKSNNITEIK